MTKIIEFLKGKKTYLIALLIGILAALDYLGISVPKFIYTALGALGLGTLRAGLTKIESK